MKSLPERLIATTKLHSAQVANVDGRLVLRNGHRIPPTLKAALKEHKVEVLRLLETNLTGGPDK